MSGSLNIFRHKSSEATKRIDETGVGGIKKGKKKKKDRVGEFSDSPPLTCGPSFAYVASLQGKGPSKRKQQRSCSWGREAVACLPSPAYGKQWIVWRAGLWQCNRRPAAAQRGLCFSTFTSPLCQYLPHREARTETPAELPPSQRNDVRPVWVLESRSGC